MYCPLHSVLTGTEQVRERLSSPAEKVPYRSLAVRVKVSRETCG